MQIRSMLRCASIFAAFATVLATAAAAQQFEILNARYGSAHRNIDVTQQLRRLAGANATFRLSWRTFGDPAEGQAKTLRIFARGPRGANRFFEYRDNDVVDGSIFSGWGAGGWGNRPWHGGWNPPGWGIGNPGIRPPGGRPPISNNRLQILSAKYGAGKQQVDVTGRVQSLVNNGRLNVQVTPRSLGVGDPVPNVVKTLFVSYSVGNGKRQTRTAQDGGYLTLP